MPISFITWYPYCRRSDAIAAALGGPSHLIHYLGFRQPLHAPLKYVLQTAATLRVLHAERPEVVLVAVPPIFAALPVWFYARRHGARFVVDAHTGIFEHTRWRWFLPITRAVMRRADAVIVTGEHLRQVVESWGGHPVIIGDVPVQFGAGLPPPPSQGPRVVIVNSFSVDEPVDALLAAARMLHDVSFFITGDTRHARTEWIESRPCNVTFTGFVSEQEYAGLLRAADLVVVLTTHDHTMQRGGYEAVALCKPLVTSDWGLLRETFSRGTIHVRNEAPAIAAGIRRAIAQRDSLACDMVLLKREREAIFTARLEELRRQLSARPVPQSRAQRRRPSDNRVDSASSTLCPAPKAREESENA